MIIVINDKKVQEQMVKEAEEEGGTSFTIPWFEVFFMASGFAISLYFLLSGFKDYKESKKE